MSGWLAEQRYSPVGGRDLRLDLLRGFCVFAMVVDHLGGPSPLNAITGNNRFYTSAAEGFVFLSGLVMGLTYRRLTSVDQLGPSLMRVIQRAGTLYFLTVTLTFFFIPLSEILGLPWAQGIDFSDPIGFVVSVLTLHRTYYLVDIPLLYTLLLLLTPIAITLLSQRRTDVLVAGSWLWWAAYQVYPSQSDGPWNIVGNYLFYFPGWQVIFVTGLVLGWHREELGSSLARFPQRVGLVIAGAGTAVAILDYQVMSRLPADAQLFLTEVVFSKAAVRPGRILATVAVFAFFYLLVTVLWRPIRSGVGWLLTPLGQSSLYAYAAHVVLAIPAALVLENAQIESSAPWLVNTTIQALALLSIWTFVRFRVLFVDPGHGWARYAWPVAATVACLIALPIDSSRFPSVARAAPEEDQYAARVARAFGTPAPARQAGVSGTPVPLPQPVIRPTPAIDHSPDAVNPYIGPLRGTALHIQFFSPALGRDMPYFIYLPPDYYDDGRLYPTLYMLHGNSGSNEEWLAYGLFDRADQLISSKAIQPMVIVLPQGDFSYWVNSPFDEGEKWSDYLSDDLVTHIGSTYHVFSGAGRRAIGGLSMGGSGALVNAFDHPNIFGVVGAHSPSLPVEGEREFLGMGFKFAQRDPVSMARMLTPRVPSRPRIWIDEGVGDTWLDRTEELNSALDARGIDHEFEVFDGDHEGGYWEAHLTDYLLFYDDALNP